MGNAWLLLCGASTFQREQNITMCFAIGFCNSSGQMNGSKQPGRTHLPESRTYLRKHAQLGLCELAECDFKLRPFSNICTGRDRIHRCDFPLRWMPSKLVSTLVATMQAHPRANPSRASKLFRTLDYRCRTVKNLKPRALVRALG